MKPFVHIIPAGIRGIYVIHCLANGRFYVGSSIDIGNRWRRHRELLNRGKHYNPKLQASWNKFGEAAFFFCVIERVGGELDLFEVEQKYLDTLACDLNIVRVAGGAVMRGRKHSAESRSKMTAGQLRYWQRRRADGKVTQSESTKHKIAESHRGQKHTAEAKAKMSRAKIGRLPWNKGLKGAQPGSRKGKKASAETIEKLRLSHLGKIQTSEQIQKRASAVRLTNQRKRFLRFLIKRVYIQKQP